MSHCAAYGVEELLMTRTQRAVARGFQVIDHTFVTVVVAHTAYSVVLLATPQGLPGVSLIVQL